MVGRIGRSGGNTSLVVDSIKESHELAGGKLAGFETNASKLANDMVSSGIERHGSLFFDIIDIIRWLLGRSGKRIKGAFGNSQLDRRKRNHHIKLFLKDTIFFDERFHKLAVRKKIFFDLLGGGGLDTI